MFELRYCTIISKVQNTESKYFYAKFYFLLIFGVFVVQLNTPIKNISQYYIIVSFLFMNYSYWVPQIFWNIKNGVTNGFSKTYMLCVSVLRLTTIVYIFLCPTSVLNMQNLRVRINGQYENMVNVNLWILLGLIMYQLSQVVILLMMDRFGARFFVPKFVTFKFSCLQKCMTITQKWVLM